MQILSYSYSQLYTIIKKFKSHYFILKLLTRSLQYIKKLKMRMLIAFLLMLLCGYQLQCSSQKDKEKPNFLIFYNDGTFYKLDPVDNYIHWYGSLGFKLINFELTDQQFNFNTENSTYFVPTVDGHFIYISKNKEILVHREQIEHLLHICFDGTSNAPQTTDNNSKKLESQSKYFLYEKYQYFVLDLSNGKNWGLEQFLNEKIIAKKSKHAIIKISKKFLKQLDFNLQVKWSVVSSAIQMISAEYFFKDPNKKFSQKVKNQKYEFRRINKFQIQIYDIEKESSFEIGGSSSVVSVFAFYKDQGSFENIQLTTKDKALLALDDKSKRENSVKNTFLNQINESKKNQIVNFNLQVFPDSSNIKKPFLEENYEIDNIQFCVNSYRAILKLTQDDEKKDTKLSQKIIYHIKPNTKTPNQIYSQEIYLPSLQISPTSSERYHYVEPTPTKEQPLVWIFLLVSIVIGSYAVYRLKINKLLSQFQKIQSKNDQKFQQIQKRLGKFEQMQKMYQIYWDKLLYKNSRRKISNGSSEDQENKSQNEGQPSRAQSYEYLIFEGKFLNKQALVYAVPLDGIDLIHIEHQLNSLLSCSHKTLTKLYYYSKNSQFLLIFCEKIQPFWNNILYSPLFKLKKSQKELPVVSSIKDLNNGSTNENAQKKQIKDDQKSKFHLITEIIECVKYVDKKIQLTLLPLSCIIINQHQQNVNQKQLQNDFKYQLRLNIIPAILQTPNFQSQDIKKSNKKIRINIVKIFHFIITGGQEFNLKKSLESINNDSGEEFFIKDFYDFILNQNYNINVQIDSPQISQGQLVEKEKQPTPQLNSDFLTHLSDHPYLWDSKRKMLFISDFSNYVQTYLDDFKVKKIQSYAKDFKIINTPWIKQFDAGFAKQINLFRKYDFYSIRDLIRLIRNKVSHFHQIPKETRNIVGKTPEAFIDYVLSIFPKLLSFTFIYAKKKKWKLHVQ